jgi:hypothetical protein
MGFDIRQLQATPLIGRKMELTEIVSRLTESGCRKLTLLGVGGSGKTRLALKIMERRRADFRHDVYFVPLAAGTVKTHHHNISANWVSTIECAPIRARAQTS